MTKVVNIKTTQEKYVKCCRPTIYGNPYILGKDGTREEVIEKYRKYFHNSDVVACFLIFHYTYTIDNENIQY